MASASYLDSTLFAPLGQPAAPRRVLAIAAHPDDELLGCGGTLALHARAGDEVTAVIGCDGATLRYGPGRDGQLEHMRREAATPCLAQTQPPGVPDLRPDTHAFLALTTP